MGEEFTAPTWNVCPVIDLTVDVQDPGHSCSIGFWNLCGICVRMAEGQLLFLGVVMGNGLELVMGNGLEWAGLSIDLHFWSFMAQGRLERGKKGAGRPRS